MASVVQYVKSWFVKSENPIASNMEFWTNIIFNFKFQSNMLKKSAAKMEAKNRSVRLDIISDINKGAYKELIREKIKQYLFNVVESKKKQVLSVRFLMFSTRLETIVNTSIMDASMGNLARQLKGMPIINNVDSTMNAMGMIEQFFENSNMKCDIIMSKMLESSEEFDEFKIDDAMKEMVAETNMALPDLPSIQDPMINLDSPEPPAKKKLTPKDADLDLINRFSALRE
jgi:hypothetical protein